MSERVAELTEAERDFVLARALVRYECYGRFANRKGSVIMTFAVFSLVALGTVPRTEVSDRFLQGLGLGWALVSNILLSGIEILHYFRARKLFGAEEERTWTILALCATADPVAAVVALHALADSKSKKREAAREAEALEKWWHTTGQHQVEASDWYQKERSLAAKGETARIPLTE